MSRLDAEVLIVGGGPVGLFLALSLLDEGVAVRLAERDSAPRPGSRSIGVHPPSLDLLDALGLAGPLIARGVRVHRGRAHGEGGELGVVDFAHCPAPHRYVLAVPQEETERVLREAVQHRAPGAIEVATFEGLEPSGRDVAIRLRVGATRVERRASIVVGCDGRRSASRAALGIPFDGSTYPGSYAMADFPDETALGDDAAIFLDRQGLLESFPLPGRVRRWVARLDRAPPTTAADLDGTIVGALVERVARRCGASLDATRAMRPSTFRAERRVARALARGRVALAGDAAHVVSPIGGQGMNLGWMGAQALASDIASALRRGAPIEGVLADNGVHRARIARVAARRAELNMWLGRPGARWWARDRLLAGVLRSPLSGLLGRAFTMRGLALGV